MKLNPKIIIHKMGENYLAYDYEKSLMHELNETAYLILEWLPENTKDEIVIKLVEKYEIGKEQAEKDYESFLGLLKKREIVRE